MTTLEPVQKPIIAIDIDDTLASSTDALRRLVNARLGVDLPPEAYTVEGPYWGYYEKIWEAHGLGDRITLDDLDAGMRQDQSMIEPAPGAFAALTQMKSDYELVVVTARSSESKTATLGWLEQHFPGIFSDVVFAEGFAGLQKKSKGQICKEIGATWLIDDSVEHAALALEMGVQVVVFGDYGWHYQGKPDGVVICKNWLDVGDYFSGR